MLYPYVALVASLGFAGLTIALVGTSWSTFTVSAIGPYVFLSLAAVIGEVRPLPIPRGDDPAETISTSAPFILALLALGGVGVAVAVQAAASVVDDVVNRRDWRKSAFNTGQYALSLLVGRSVYCALTGTAFFAGPTEVTTSDLGPLLLAGVSMVAVNRLLVAGVVALAVGQRLLVVLRDDAHFLLATNAVLLSVGAIAAHVALDGVGVLALLTTPVIAAYLTTAAAIRQAHLASHDALTGLRSRDRLHKDLDRACVGARRSEGPGPGLVLIDLDHFKHVNDSLGHLVGDQLLRQVADRITAALDDECVAYRLGGDEFAVVVEGDESRTQEVAAAILGALSAPMTVSEVEILVRASAGLAIAPHHGDDAGTLMKNADIALYHAKLDRDRTCTYSARYAVNTVERLRLLTDLRAAIDAGQLAVEYQPQVDLVTRRVVAVEALIRWRHPERGMVPPDSFIPLAENSGLIGELTEYVLDAALATLAGWRRAGHDIRMSINLSARHLSELSLPRVVTESLDRHGVPASSLVLEVTETGILSDPARVDLIIGALRLFGIGIAVDDYGTGHASLGYLKRLDIDELKIDRSFVSDMGRDAQDHAIVRSTLALARDLGLRVVAEGIEEESTAAELRALGCDVGQGYHLGRPVPAAEIVRILGEQTAPVPPRPATV
ncbi:EAL domain-containing protein [Actinotalea sp. AC32]|nr:EAL domain-containing protein [Actinotalea sp. AC32]